MVQEPGFFTLTAALVRMAWSRSVAVMFKPVVFRFEEKVRQNRNGGFALDHALRRREFPYQILAAYGNLHRCPLCGRLLDFGFTDRHTPRPPL
jgi:hypothetical protein